MTNNDETAKLAREYVADVYGGDTDFIDEAENVISWLLRTHCIVSKEEVRIHYNLAKSNIKIQYLEACQFEVGATKVLESLFDAETFKNSEV